MQRLRTVGIITRFTTKSDRKRKN